MFCDVRVSKNTNKTNIFALFLPLRIRRLQVQVLPDAPDFIGVFAFSVPSATRKIGELDQKQQQAF
jgi:hypothetical protein